METLDCIRTRRSVRKYKDKPVKWDDVVTLLDAAKYAPTSGNIQNFKVLVVQNPSLRKKMAEAAFNQTWIEQAPVHLVILTEPEKAHRFYGIRGERLYSVQNCAAVAENILLAAHDLGLGACWVGAFDEDKVASALVFPENAIAQAIITIGYADEKPTMPPKTRIEVLSYFESWGVRRRIPPLGYYSIQWEKQVGKAKKTIRKLKDNIKGK